MWTSAQATKASRTAGAAAPGERGGPRHHVLEREAVSVGEVEPLRVEAPRDRGRAEIAGAEAHALLVGEADHLDGLRRHALDRGERDQHAERAVVAARVAHRVQVRAEHQRTPDAA